MQLSILGNQCDVTNSNSLNHGFTSYKSRTQWDEMKQWQQQKKPTVGWTCSIKNRKPALHFAVRVHLAHRGSCENFHRGTHQQDKGRRHFLHWGDWHLWVKTVVQVSTRCVRHPCLLPFHWGLQDITTLRTAAEKCHLRDKAILGATWTTLFGKAEVERHCRREGYLKISKSHCVPRGTGRRARSRLGQEAFLGGRGHCSPCR